MWLTNGNQNLLEGKPVCKVTTDCIKKSLSRSRHPIEEPVNDPKKPPVKEPDDPLKRPPEPEVPPLEKPWDIPPAPPIRGTAAQRSRRCTASSSDQAGNKEPFALIVI
jgi:hypothetical protein